jgi:hypothetical protein
LAYARAVLAPAFAVLVLAVLLAAAAAAEPIAVRAAVHPGYGRLVFEWPSPIEVESRRSADRLTLRFARPFAADLNAAAGRLRDYLIELTRGAGERELVLRLLPGVMADLEVYQERIVVLDLTAAAPAASAAVGLRTGVHDGFVRIVLDWAGPIDFATAGADRRWRILFDREGEIDATAIARRFPDLLDEVSATRSDGRSELLLALRPGVRADVFEVAGERVVVDLHLPGAARPSGAAKPATAAAPAAPDPAAPAHAELSQPAAAPEVAPARGEVTALAPAAAALTGGPPGGKVMLPVPLTLRIGTAEVARGVALDFAWSQPVAAAFLLRAGHLWSVFASAADPADPPVLPTLASSVPGHLGPGELVEAVGGIAIRFPLRRPLAATVERAGARWRVILDAAAAPPRPARLERRQDPPRVRLAADDAPRLVSVIDPEVGDRLEFWPLLAGQGQPRSQRLVDVELLATAQGLAWRALSDGVQTRIVEGAVELSAPEGLHLSVPPALAARAAHDRSAPPTAAISHPPDPRAPETHGPEEDGPTAAHEGAPARDGAPSAEALAAPGPVPPPGDAPMADASRGGALRAEGPARPERFGPLALTRFAGAQERALREQRVALQGRIASVPEPERSAARLDLARGFLAQAMAAEALAVLARMGEPDAEHPDRLARASLTGAAELLMGRLTAAAAGLAARALDADPEAALWRAALAAAQDDWPGAAAELERSGSILASYPPALQLRLGLVAARIAIEVGDHDRARLVLDRLAALDLHPGDRARLAFVEGLAQARRGALDRADEIWRALAQAPDYGARIAADHARTAALLDAGRLDLDHALAKLAAARALWRGHPLEFEMLDGLAELHLRQRDRAAAMRIWQELLVRFADAPGAERIATRLRDGFVGALLGEDGMTIGAVQAYALYQDFPTLLRFEGALGDGIRHRLAAALAGLDLIEPAAGLLDELVGRSLDGPARAAAGAELTEVWLRAPNPAAALDALTRSEVADELPPRLGERRRLLRARALAAADQRDAALALLEVRRGPSEQRLRAEILWQQRDWPRLAAGLEALLKARDPAAPLSGADQELVIRLAIAHARREEHGALADLRARFGPAMRGQAAEAAFLMATAAPGMAGSERPAERQVLLAGAAEHLARVRAYLASELTSP